MNSMPIGLEEAKVLLKRIYGYDDFRPGQRPILSDILAGRDTIGVMPTGGGKSICYQIPALLLPGTTIVISPLISLMKDQVDALDSLGVSAAYLNSTLSAKEAGDILRRAQLGEYKLLYIAPERLETERFTSLLHSLHVPLVAIDEAHCVSQWGHDFRTSYLRISPFLDRFIERPRIAAFTATATEDVRGDIGRLLGFREPALHITGFDRPNLTFRVLKGVDRDMYVREYVKQHEDEAGIIYTATRREADELHGALRRMGVPAGKYHAGLSDEERDETQTAFLKDDLRVIVATNAFGMGIDKSNVRYVLHWNLPKNMEAYYQEAGRAGRDGEPGECILLFNAGDIMTQKFLIEKGTGSPERQSYELRRLRRMVDYCHTRHCLRSFILDYFGQQAESESCGNCGTCSDEGALEDVTEEAQMVISCVRRMNERFGVTLTAQVLKGSSNQKVKQFGFDKLSTYGLLRKRSEKDITGLIQLLLADGYLALSDGKFPVVKLAPTSAAVLRGEERVYRRSAEVRREERAGEAVFTKLRALRKQIADRSKVPPYVVFSDSTLREMAVLLPTTRYELLKVKGIGEAKLDKYGDAFLALLREEAGA